MNYLRVILATVAIFATGALTGYFLAHKAPKPPGGSAASSSSVLAGTNAPPSWNQRRDEMWGSLQKELKATDEQMAKVDEILSQSRKRSREIWQTIKIPLEEEVDRVKEEIRGVLDAEQAAKYEEIMKQRGKHGRDKKDKAFGGLPDDPKSCRLNAPLPAHQCFL